MDFVKNKKLGTTTFGVIGDEETSVKSIDKVNKSDR